MRGISAKNLKKSIYPAVFAKTNVWLIR